MSVSLEALAMAGKDYLSIAMTVEEWERGELTPPHLLAEDEEEKDERNLGEQVLGKETKKGREGGRCMDFTPLISCQRHFEDYNGH
ncbi:hypothetical protein GBA52_020029 [Prunus armeniaca]|nr:hypothetical protein GBA52_020029 [Prunus armeniaca]